MHQRDLLDDLNLGLLLDELLSRGCISGDHVTAIKQDGNTERQQRVRPLDIMARRSFKQYIIFLDALREAKERNVKEQQGSGQSTYT